LHKEKAAPVTGGEKIFEGRQNRISIIGAMASAFIGYQKAAQGFLGRFLFLSRPSASGDRLTHRVMAGNTP
jgi:hypothetical protein